MAKHYIKEWRKERGLTQQQVVDRMEKAPGEPLLSFSQYNRIERQRQPYSQQTLEAIAEALNASPAQLLEDNPTKDSEIVDLTRRLSELDDQKRNTVIAMLHGVLGKAG